MGKQNNSTAVPPKEHDIYTDPALSQAATDDAFVAFILQNWKRLLLAAAAIGATFFVITAFQNTRLARQRSSADIYARVRAEFAEMEPLYEKAAAPGATEEDKKKLADARGRLDALLKAQVDADAPYDSIAKIYRGLDAAKAGNMEEAKRYLGSYNWTVAESGSDERFFGELAALALAKLTLEKDIKAGREALKELLSKGEFAAAGAGHALAGISLTPEEKSETLGLLQSYTGSHPEQAAVLKEDIDRLSK